MSKENISIETESFEKEGEQVRIRCSPSNNCIVNHLVLEQIASLLSCHRHRVKYISHSTNNLYITTRFFFFFPFVVFIIRRNLIDQGSRPCRSAAPRARKFIPRRRYHHGFLAAGRKRTMDGRRERSCVRGGGEGVTRRTATGTPDELVDLGN